MSANDYLYGPESFGPLSQRREFAETERLYQFMRFRKTILNLERAAQRLGQGDTKRPHRELDAARRDIEQHLQKHFYRTAEAAEILEFPARLLTGPLSAATQPMRSSRRA